MEGHRHTALKPEARRFQLTPTPAPLPHPSPLDRKSLRLRPIQASHQLDLDDQLLRFLDSLRFGPLLYQAVDSFRVLARVLRYWGNTVLRDKGFEEVS